MKYENVAIKQAQFHEIKWFCMPFQTHLVILVLYANMTY
jgi:hypothetical protein